MAEYIEREKTLSKVRRCRFSGKNLDGHEMSFNNGIYEAAIAIEKIPAADVRPERYGEWLVSGDCYECSECGGGSVVNTNPYCWKCGAKMDGSGKSDNWISTSEQLPPENQIVDTKIDDEKGVRNEQELVFSHNFWFLPDKSMYVYYTPTHWRGKAKMDGKDSKK